ncbi:phosphomannomutase/phosphoglucomutase [Marinobacter halodurans]|uniref:phosphomannomutase n=1 Tax=Marinobacter halodurans TaxID=2528979 RepID=A0ABY1ZTZ1_9GAMM|nr:phosphomannomutase/phosphoglucomutase [Marinobacter halodurans]TBW58839.1 phosphomannomutase/phosphoglucomutase [Marinobacter halodurans]
MKLGKKKTPEAENEAAQPREKSKKASNSKAGNGPKLKGLASVAGQQAAVVLLAGIAAAALLYYLVLIPAHSERQSLRAEHVADMARERIDQRLAILEQVVTGYARQSHVRQALSDPAAMPQVVGDLKQMLPGTRASFLFPYGGINRRPGQGFELSFVNLDLAKQAESGREVHPDAFPRDGQWYIQFAAPITDPGSHAVKGTLLVVFDPSVMTPALAVNDAELGGRLELVQSVSGSSKTVVASGSGGGQAISRTLSSPNWSVEFKPQRDLPPLVDPLLALIVVVVPSVIAMILVWVLLGRARSDLRRDAARLIQWAHKAFAGERIKAPPYTWDLVATIGEVLGRLAQAVDKRIAKADETARQATRKAAPATGQSKAKAKAKSSEEPLFEDNDMLDIDMLDSDEDVLGLGGGKGEDPFSVEEAPAVSVEISPSIFRAYDIRGIVGETLDGQVVHEIGRAIGSEAQSRQVTDICIGYDGRHSSPELADALARGIMSTGCNVINIGAVPTPVLYFATHELGTGSGVMVTGSHNPANYNGLKMMLAQDTLSGDDIEKLYTRIQTGDLVQGQGQYSEQDVRRPYLDRIVGDIAVAAPLRVVLDAGNGIAGELAPILVEELGCEVIPLFCEVDGNFPNHHPDPGKPENLTSLIEKVKSERADIGLAFDGDGDRLGVVTNTGKVIWPDRLLMLFARDVVSRNPGSDILYDVKCTRRLASVINEAGGRPIMWKTGHSLMKAKMKETGALLAGEMSGHIFFKERWMGFDDGLYAAARLLEILGVEDRDSDDVFAEFPEDISTPELNVTVTDENKFGIVDKLSAEGEFGDGSVSNIDGVRVDYPDGWGLCRASNTTPVLVLRFEAETGEALERIKTVFREQLLKVAPDVVPEF